MDVMTDHTKTKVESWGLQVADDGQLPQCKTVGFVLDCP
jgi:hypothetical protein